MKKSYFVILSILSLLCIVFIFKNKKVNLIVNTVKTVFKQPTYVDEKGLTITSRVKVLEGYTQVTYPKESFQNYIQNYSLKPFGNKVINYDGSPYFYQSGHIGILKVPVPKNGLQQCADALIRLRAEYLWEANRKNEIGFEFTSGHYCSWKKYAMGYRPKVKGNKVSFHKTAGANHSKDNFYNYLNLIYMYSGTLSLYNELPKITSEGKLQVGDMLVNPGTPGHIVLLVDEIVDSNGQKRFVLAQGNTPAQSVHMLKNPTNSTINPWYHLKHNDYIEIPGYYFENAQFIRFKN